MFLSARMSLVSVDVIVGRSLIPFQGAVPITSEQSDIQSVENLSRLAEHAYESENLANLRSHGTAVPGPAQFGSLSAMRFHPVGDGTFGGSARRKST